MKHVFALLALVMMSSGYAQVPESLVGDGLVAWWPFEGNFNDFSGNNNHCNVNGLVPFVEDRNGIPSAAISFSGNGSNFLSVIYSQESFTFTEGLSISAWVNSNSGSGDRRVLQMGGTDASGKGFHILKRNTRLGYKLQEGGANDPAFGLWSGSAATTPISLGEWHHIVFSVDFASLQWNTFLDGVLVESGISPIPFEDNQIPLVFTQTFEIGRKMGTSNNGDAWSGFIDDIGIWNRDLGTEEVQQMFAMQTVGCTDEAACNYDAFVLEDDGSCAYPAYGQDCNGDCASGTAWHVDGNASEADATGEAVAPFATIQAAADVACEGDTIFVAPGVYLENVSLTQSHVVLTGYAYSEVSEPIAEQVIIDGGELGTTLFVSGEYTELAHLTIQNGRSGYGAGLYLDGSHHSWIHDCVIRDNVGTGDITAHGIQLGASHCVIEDCLVTGNYGRKHTINAGGSDNVIRNCRIVDNTAWETGGGIVAYTDRMLIENCLIASNEGGGITTYNDNTVVDHCTVTGNGGFGFFIWCLDDADMYVSNTVASGNGSTEVKIQQTGNQVGTFHVRNSLIEGGVDYEWTSVYKVIDSDASLLELSPNLTGDYTLSSISPAIGHGTDFRYDFDGLLEGEGSVEDLSGDTRPQPSGTMPDLGCFEHPLGMPEPTFGCTDSSACNFEAGVTDDDGSCIFPTCDDITACNYDPDAVCGGGVCIPSGCLEPEACNFNPNAECEGETCDYTCCPGPGCCDLPAVWDSAAQMCVVVESICGEGTTWDESLQQCLPEDMCFADLDNDGVVGMADLLDLLTQFGSECAE